MPWRIFKILLTITLLLSAVMIVSLLWLTAEPKVIALPWLIEPDVDAWKWGFVAFWLFIPLALWLDRKEPRLLPPMVWRILRFCWTLIFLFFVLAIVSSARPGGMEIWWVLAAIQCPGMATLWLDGDYKNPLIFVSVNTLLALSLAYWTYRVAIGDVYFFPLHCKGDVVCELQDLLHALGGPIASALPWALLSGGLLFASYRAFRQWRNPGCDDTTIPPNG
jgi:hypothetical protein